MHKYRDFRRVAVHLKSVEGPGSPLSEEARMERVCHRYASVLWCLLMALLAQLAADSGLRRSQKRLEERLDNIQEPLLPKAAPPAGTGAPEVPSPQRQVRRQLAASCVAN